MLRIARRNEGGIVVLFLCRAYQGDLDVEIKVEFPRSISASAVEALRAVL